MVEKDEILNKSIVSFLKENKASAQEACKEFKVGKKRVYSLMKENGLYTHKIFSNKIQRQIINEYLSGESIPVLTKKYEVTKNSIYGWIRRRGLSPITNKSPVLEKTKNILSLLCSGCTVKEIMKTLSVSKSSVQNVCYLYRKTPGKAILVKPTNINDDYFEKIDSQKKAYFLGLLCADGCVQDKISRISISLKEPDQYLIEALRSELKTTYKITRYQPPMPNSCPAHNFQFYSAKIKADLIRHGCTPRKSLTLILPNVQKEYFWHFFRGYFDGDGCISGLLKKRGGYKTRLAITSSRMFTHQLHEYLLNNFNIGSCLSNPKGTNVWNLIIVKKDHVKMVAEMMYNDAEIYMKRKRDKFDYYHSAIKAAA